VVMFGWPDWKIEPVSNSSKCIEQVKRVASRLGIGPAASPGRRSWVAMRQRVCKHFWSAVLRRRFSISSLTAA
jgi:hypothetical protein